MKSSGSVSRLIALSNVTQAPDTVDGLGATRPSKYQEHYDSTTAWEVTKHTR